MSSNHQANGNKHTLKLVVKIGFRAIISKRKPVNCKGLWRIYRNAKEDKKRILKMQRDEMDSQEE